MFVLLFLETKPRGTREDSYLGMFESIVAAEEYLLTHGWLDDELSWREMARGTGPFESICLHGLKPRAALRADLRQNQELALLEF